MGYATWTALLIIAIVLLISVSNRMMSQIVTVSSMPNGKSTAAKLLENSVQMERKSNASNDPTEKLILNCYARTYLDSALNICNAETLSQSSGLDVESMESRLEISQSTLMGIHNAKKQKQKTII